MNHGGASSYRKCAEENNGKACESCLTGKRNGDRERQRRRRDKLAGSVTEHEPARPVLTVVSDETAAPKRGNASRDTPQAAAGPSHSRDRVARYDMPRLWPTLAAEPSWAAEHREALAAVADLVLDDPENYQTTIGFTDDTPKAEKKDFTRLTREFIKANPGIINYYWSSDRYYINSPDYIEPDNEELEEIDTEEALNAEMASQITEQSLTSITAQISNPNPQFKPKEVFSSGQRFPRTMPGYVNAPSVPQSKTLDLIVGDTIPMPTWG